MKNVVITGANKGIGFEVARQLLQRGYFVFLGSRDVAKGQSAAEKLKLEGWNSVEYLQMDVTDALSIETAVKQLSKKISSLDLLINNAGILGNVPQQASSVNLSTIRSVFETNFFGAVMVTQQLIPLLSKSNSPVIINITSDLASLTNHSNPEWRFYPYKSAAYGPSKTALNAYTVMLAHELKDQNFRVNCITPGHTATDFNQHRGEKTVQEAACCVLKYVDSKDTGKFFDEYGTVSW